ncbi:hypothetical protein ABW19_dt0210343 [Dactylella cylindrospora]|nr:hypothetical protein ABW19_dt0210343 [Dactylella cylindrospora]
MPPKKAAPVVEDPASSEPASEDEKPKSKGKDRDGISIDDNTLPKTIITRLAKGALGNPSNPSQQAQILFQKDAVTAITRGSTVFINYLANCANDIAKETGRKTIMPKHVLEAIECIEFKGFSERLKVELDRFTEKQVAKRTKAKSRTSLAANTTTDSVDPMSEDDAAAARPSKRQRKSLANEDKDGGGDITVDSNILEGDSNEDEEGGEEEEGEEGEEGDEEGETGEEGESGQEEGSEEMEDRVEDLDQDDQMEDDDDEALDDDSD